MQGFKTVDFKKSEGIIKLENARDNLHILKFISDDPTGRQGSIAFAINKNLGDRLEVIKFYGLVPCGEDDQKKVFYAPNNVFWSRVREHEISALARLDDSGFPTAYTTGEYCNVLYTLMSFGRKKDTRQQELPELLTLKEGYEDGAVLTLEQILYHKHNNNPKQIMLINTINSYDYKTKLRYFAEIFKNVLTLHKHGIVHNDLKPSQIIFITPQSDSPKKPQRHQHAQKYRHIIQTIDLGSHINLHNLDTDHWVGPTTPLYSSRECLEAYLSYESGDKSAIETIRANPDQLKERDFYALGLIGCEFLLGMHPYAHRVQLALEQHPPRILQNSSTQNSPISYISHDLFTFDQYRVILKEIHSFLKRKRQNGFSLNISGRTIPLREEQKIHQLIS